MHEYGLVEGILERVAEVARAQGACKVERVHISLGELSGVDAVLLVRAYETFRERTVCATAPLEVRTVAARWACSRCELPIERGALLRCPGCGSAARMVSGDELFLERVELEVG